MPLYVDDIIIIKSYSKDVNSLIQLLNSKFAIKNLGLLYYFFGTVMHYLAKGNLLLNQPKYITKLLPKVHMSDAKPYDTYEF